MKKIISILLVLLVFLTATISSFAATSIKSKVVLDTKEDILENIWHQLEAQNATKFYPLYKKMIEDRFSQSLEYGVMSSRSSVYMPKGGAVYYEDYLNTGTKVYQTYLDEEATNKALDGTLTGDTIGNFLMFGLGSIWWPLSLMATVATIADREVDRQIRNGTGCMELMVSDDGDTSAEIKLHWSTAPYVTVYSGAETSIVE